MSVNCAAKGRTQHSTVVQRKTGTKQESTTSAPGRFGLNTRLKIGPKLSLLRAEPISGNAPQQAGNTALHGSMTSTDQPEGEVLARYLHTRA